MTLTGMSKGNTDTWLNDRAEKEAFSDPQCNICHGAGFVHPLSDSGVPDFNKVVQCQCTQVQFQKERITRLQKFSNLGALSRLTFENLLPAGKEKGNKQKYNFARAYEAARAFASCPKGWLVFIGPNGCGKTHLACSIANFRISNSQMALYIGVADLLDHLRSAFHPDSNVAEDDMFERVKTTPLLILDGLDT